MSSSQTLSAQQGPSKGSLKIKAVGTRLKPCGMVSPFLGTLVARHVDGGLGGPLVTRLVESRFRDRMQKVGGQQASGTL